MPEPYQDPSLAYPYVEPNDGVRTYGQDANSNLEIDRAADQNSMLGLGGSADIAERLLSVHPDYHAEVDKWRKYADLYESDNVYKYVAQHPRETNPIFQKRLSRAAYFNYCASVVDLFVAYMFSADISRNLASTVDKSVDTTLQDLFKDIYRDADLQNNSYEMVMHDIATKAQVYGHVGVLVDAPRMGESIMTERDRKDAKARPFLTVYSPLQIMDWSRDRFGNFNWVKLEVPVEDTRTFKQEVDLSERRFLIWDRTHWELWSVKEEGTGQSIVKTATLVDEAESPIQGEVPFVVFRNCRRLKHDWFGNSTLKDIADINIAILNWESLADEEIHNRCLNILAMERDNTGDVAASLSHNNVLEYSTGTSAPTYLTPGETPLNLIGQWIDRAKDEIYRLAKLGGSTGLSGVREATSGIAYAYEFNETNQSLVEKAASMESGENKIHSLLARWMSRDFTGTIEYPRDFGVDDFLLELDILMKARDTLSSSSAIKEMEKRLTSKLFSRKDLDFRTKVEDEIETGNVAQIMAGSFASVPPVITLDKKADPPIPQATPLPPDPTSIGPKAGSGGGAAKQPVVTIDKGDKAEKVAKKQDGA